jgi:glycosyltransferase involved in cell wall biosynthesis
MNDDLLFGIVTPTYRRPQFLRRFIRNLRRQTYTNFVFVLVHDGPNPETHILAKKLFRSDPRMVSLATEARSNNWGVTPRIRGLQYLSQLPRVPDYLLMWDDDNAFFNTALELIRQEIRAHRNPDLILMNLRRDYDISPLHHGSDPQNFTLVDTGTLVPKFGLAQKLYPMVEDSSGDLYSQDGIFFRHCLRELSKDQIHAARQKVIGRYDGLRRLYTLRVILRIPTLAYLHKFSWYRKLRLVLRG